MGGCASYSAGQALEAVTLLDVQVGGRAFPQLYSYGKPTAFPQIL